MFLKHAGLQLKKGEYLCSHRQTIVMIPVSGRNVVFSAFTIWMVPTSVLRSTMAFPALQHRGQESCGIAVSDTSGPKGHVKSYKGLGLVNEVFKESKLEELSGNIGIGHVRYSYHRFHYRRECTAARSELSERLPFPFAQRKSGQRYGTGCEQMENTGAIFHTSIDSEIIAYGIARERVHSKTVEEAILRTVKEIRGAMPLSS